jgi:hypothetical protein
MKRVLVSLGLFLSLATVGMGCGPKEKYCYLEGTTCREEAAKRDAASNQSDASDAAEAGKVCYDNNGHEIPCP